MKTQIKCFLLIFAFAGLTNCESSHLAQMRTPEVGMFKVAILYPNEEGKTFDMDYYEQKHMPMMADLLGKNLKFYEIDKGVAGRTPNDKVPFVTIGYFYCYDIAEYNNVIIKNIETIRNDIKNYTDIQPTIQISEIRQLKFSGMK